MIRNRVGCLSQQHGKDESVWEREWGSGGEAPRKILTASLLLWLEKHLPTTSKLFETTSLTFAQTVYLALRLTV